MIKNTGKFNDCKLQAVIAKLEQMQRLSVVVGVPMAKNAARGETNNATIAAAHEFGVPGHIPERSFLRSTVAENKEAAISGLAQGINKALTGNGDIRTLFDKVGKQLAGLVQRKIQSGIKPDLKEKTKTARKRKNKAAKAKKGRSMKPLIDTGQLLQSITWEVRDD